MKSKQPMRYGIGLILFDCYMFVEAFIDVRAGRMTNKELFTLIVLSVISAFFLVALLKKKIQKERKR